jgi:pyruvate dehydrogenase complex dehydrogenase (E1) component
MPKNKWNDKWMQKLLNESEVASLVSQMTAAEKDFFKQLLYKQGTYGRYVIEQQNKQVKDIVKESFPKLVK